MPNSKNWTLLAMVLAVASGGCGDDAAATPSGAPAGSGQGGAAAAGGAGGGGLGGGGLGGGGAGALEQIVSFDAAAGELPEGLAVRGPDLYVGHAMLGAIVRFDSSGGGRDVHAQIPGLPTDNAFVTGLTFDTSGQLYAAVPSFVANPLVGVYRAPAGGGAVSLFATHAGMVFPSGLGFDAAGVLYVTDSMAGAVFRIDASGGVEVFVQDALLQGDKTICGNDAALFDIGANGIVVDEDAIVVAVTDQASVLRIPIGTDGTAGAIEVLAGPDCATLGGIDGIVRGGDGTIYAALNHQNRIAAIDTDGMVTVAVDDPLLDFPASVSIGQHEGSEALFITNFALNNALAGKPANPGLLRWVTP